jgi:uncharacterized protein YcaQ
VRDFDTSAKQKQAKTSQTTANTNTNEGWWNWGPAKRAIERLYMQGDLMICKRIGMEKIYDIKERCLPNNINLSVPSLAEYSAYIFNTMLRAQGVFTFKQLIHLRTGKAARTAMQNVVNEQLSEGVIMALNHNGEPVTSKEPIAFYANVCDLNTVREKKLIKNKQVNILSPFDNSLIHRDRLSQLFNFDYTIECYVTPKKRKFGYFSLPVLYNNEFVGRIDCKAHRSEKRFELISMHTEPSFTKKHIGNEAHATFMQSFTHARHDFAQFNGCAVTS